jgi:hypothetical protein
VHVERNDVRQEARVSGQLRLEPLVERLVRAAIGMRLVRSQAFPVLDAYAEMADVLGERRQRVVPLAGDDERPSALPHRQVELAGESRPEIGAEGPARPEQGRIERAGVDRDVREDERSELGDVERADGLWCDGDLHVGGRQKSEREPPTA